MWKGFDPYVKLQNVLTIFLRHFGSGEQKTKRTFKCSRLKFLDFPVIPSPYVNMSTDLMLTNGVMSEFRNSLNLTLNGYLNIQNVQLRKDINHRCSIHLYYPKACRRIGCEPGRTSCL